MQDFEVILINDCSTDNSREVIEAYLSDPRIRLVDHSENVGYVGSLIEGCNLSNGKYMTVISADDYVLDIRAFESTCACMEAFENAALCYSAWSEVDNEGRVRHTRRGGSTDYVRPGCDEVRRLLISSPVLHSGALIRRTAYIQVGGYDERCRFSVDTNMWLSLCSVGSVAYVNRPLYAYRAHDTNMSNTGGALWRATEEMLIGIDAALDRFSIEQLPDRPRLRHAGIQRALLAVPTLDIFAGRLSRGWHGYMLAARRYPAETIFQTRTIALIVRSILGPTCYDFMARLRHRPTDSSGEPETKTNYA
jgi:glycosyltransferase involved in cell wall biosynthesis